MTFLTPKLKRLFSGSLQQTSAPHPTHPGDSFGYCGPLVRGDKHYGGDFERRQDLFLSAAGNHFGFAA